MAFDELYLKTDGDLFETSGIRALKWMRSLLPPA